MARGTGAVARCDRCGSEVSSPIKTWRVGKNVVGQFACPVCGHSFKRGLKAG